jgi:hypothetical protein
MTQKDLAQKGAGQINAFLEESKLNKAQAKKDEEARIFAQNHPDPTKEEEGLVDPVAMFTPFVSDVIDVGKAIGSALQGDLGGAALGMVAAVPVVGDAAKAAIKANKKSNKVDEPVNLQKTISEYDATWSKFEEIDDVDEWQATVRKHVSEKRVDNPDVRTPELEESARQLSELKITREEHLANVDKYKPVREWTDVPREPSNKTIVFSLNEGQRTKGSFVFGSAAAKSLGVQKSALSIGDSFNGRLDIPAYKAYDTWVVAGTSKGLGGTHYAKAIHYQGKDGGPVKFLASQKIGERIGTGELKKTPYATVSGVIKDLDPDAIRKNADELMNDPEWIQVGFDPRRQGAFYVRGGENSGMAVLEADEVIQVGALLLAKKAVLDPTKKNFNKGGLVDAEMETLNFSHGGDVHGKAQALDSDQRLKMFTDFVQSNTEGAKKEDTLVERFKGWVENAVRPDTTEQKPVAEEDTLVGRFKGWVEESVKAGQQRVDAKTMESEEIDVVQAPVVEAPVVEVQPEVEVETRTAADIQTDEILSKATPDIGFVDEVLLDFENSEGIYKHKSVEGGEDTGPYGLKDGMADLNMADFTTEGKVDYKAAATSLLKIRVGQLNKGYPKFNSMPSSLKKTLLSTVWNQGVSGANELRKGINKAMELPQEKQGAAVIAIMKTDLLDGIAAMDDKGTKDKSDDRKRPMVGLMARKAADYNLTAQHYGLPLIASWDLVDKKDDYKIGGVTFREKATYYDEQGNVLKVHYKESRKHRNSSRAGSFKTNKVKSASVDNTDWAGAIT